MNKARVIRALLLATDVIEELSLSGTTLDDNQVENCLEIDAVLTALENEEDDL
jgi:hypothetical protein